MPRRRRLDLPNVPQHIVQRGNNRGACFFCDDDRLAYLMLLSRHARRLGVDVHAYVLMTNHVHLLVTPRAHGAVSTLMQDIGREYVRTVNSVHRRTGTLWEGRFHACLVESERYLLTCMRYIELNPVRAGMVDEASCYRWSSHRANALNESSDLIAAHHVYLALASSDADRCAAYRALFRTAPNNDEMQALRRHTRQRAAWGGERFQREVECALGRKAFANARGRPRRPVNGI
jgi:putative transposase